MFIKVWRLANCTGDALMRRGQCGGCKSVLNEPIWRKQNKAKEEKKNID